MYDTYGTKYLFLIQATLVNILFFLLKYEKNKEQYLSKDMYTSGEYLDKKPTWHIQDSLWKAKQIIKIINNNQLKPGTICEIGCGAGEILNQLYMLMPSNINFFGYEISPQAFEFCQKRYKDRLKYYLNNLFADDGTFFDIILAIDVIEHVEDYFGFLRSLLKKGQYKIFHIPLDLSVQYILRGYPLIRKQQDGHINYFTKETALATLKDIGYNIIDYFYTAISVDFPAKSFKSLLLKLPRKFLFKINKNMTVRILGGYSLMVLTQ